MSKSYFKVIMRDETWNVRDEAKKLGFLFQLYIDPKSPRHVFIKYKTVKDAEKARASLAQNENVVAVESIEEWTIQPSKKMKEAAAAKNPPSEVSAPMYNKPQNQPSSAGNISQPFHKPLMPMFNCCSFCSQSGSQYQCFICGSFYCSENCQDQDWPGHIMKCKPRLIKAHPTTFIAMNGWQPEPSRANSVVNRPNDIAHSVNRFTNQSMKENQPIPKVAAQESHNSKKTHNQSLGGPQKTTPISNVPTNVLKNLAMKRRQDLETSDDSALLNNLANGEQNPLDHANNGPLSANAALEGGQTTKTKDANNFLKRMQKKIAPVATKREVLYGPFPDEGEYVKISYVSDKELYIYRSGPEQDGKPNRFLSAVKRSLECAKGVQQRIKNAPNVDDILFAPFDGAYYRAIIKKVDGTNVVIFYPDFGNVQTVQWSTLKEIPDQDVKYGTCYTHAVTFENVPVFSSSMRVFLTVMQEMEEFEVINIVEKPNTSTKAVEMRHVQQLYLLSQKLQEMDGEQKSSEGTTASNKAVPNPATYEPVTVEHFEELDIPNGKKVEMIIVEASELNNTNQLSLLLQSDSDEFAKVLIDCERFGKLDPNPYVPKQLDHACLVQFDGVWWRGLPVDRSETAVLQCYLLDLGIIRPLNKDAQCRRFPATLSRKLFVCECIVDNIDELCANADDNNESLRGKKIEAMYYQQDHDGGDQNAHIKILTVLG